MLKELFKDMPLEVRAAFKALGRQGGLKGGKKGGKRSLETMTPAQRTARAKKAAAARWGVRTKKR